MTVKHYTLELTEREVQLVSLALAEAGCQFSKYPYFRPDGEMMIEMGNQLEDIMKHHNILSINHLKTSVL